MQKRICLLAGYDKRGIVQDYVLYLARKLSKISEVYYFADGKFKERELSKMRVYTRYAGAAAHKGSYFGSWQCLIAHLGWEKITSYDEMIICNDSVYGPMSNMEDIFDYMDLRDYDFWGLTENYNSHYHIDSYFMVFKNDVLKHPKFQEFWRNIMPSQNSTYESVLTPFLTELGFNGNSYIKNYKKEDQLAYPLHLFRYNHMPFTRVTSFKTPATTLNEPILHIDSKIKKQTGYDADLILRHLASEEGFKGFGAKYYMQKGFEKMKKTAENWFMKQ